MRSAVSLPSCCAASSAVMVAGEGVGLQILHAILDPLHGFPPSAPPLLLR